MENLPSEQIKNDGGYHWYTLVANANQRLKQIGKHGKRATIKVIPKPNKPISAQFSLHNKQRQKGLNLQLNKANLIKAEEICTLISSQLVADTFTDDWLNSLLGKQKIDRQEKLLTCKEMLEAYKKHYFKQRKGNKTPDISWSNGYRHIEKILNLHHSESINLQIIKEIIDATENNTSTRARHLNGIVDVLNYFDNKDFKSIIKQYKKGNKPKTKKKHIPSDNEILYVYQFGFKPESRCPKKYFYRYSQWQFLYGILTVYGLRVHEAWNIANWDKPVVLKNGDWVGISDDTDDIESENEEIKLSYHQVKKQIIIPAILDPDNQNYLLCIGHNTKTGYRVTFPLGPSGHTNNCKWIKEFNLIQPLNLPDIKNPLTRTTKETSYACSKATSNWFNRHEYEFSPHSLRHAYNIRGHKLAINQKILADSLGHGLLMNSSTYLRHEGYESKIQGLNQEISIDNTNKSKIKKLEDENKHLKLEIEKLKTELKMYKTLESIPDN